MKIEFNNAIISNEKLKLTSTHTEYVNLDRMDGVTVKDFTSKVKLLTRLCRENKVKFSKKAIKSMTAEFPSYESAVLEYNGRFSKLKAMFEEIVKEGLFAPTNANAKLTSAMSLRNEICAMFYRSQILSRFEELNHKIDKHLKESNLSRFEKIYL